MKKLLVLLADSLSTFHEKGEIKPRYYNPGNLFEEIHLVSPATRDIEPSRVQSVAGTARLFIHPLGPSCYLTGWLPFGRLGQLVKRVAPDVIRAYDPGLRGSLAVWWARRMGIPAVVSIHADLDDQRRMEQRPIHLARMLLERYTLPRADAVICVSRYLEPYAKRHGARSPTVIYNKVYTDQFQVRRNGHRDGLTVLCIGRLVRQKYQACLIQAVHRLEARLILIGQGALRGDLQRLASELGMTERVEFIDAVPHAEIGRYYGHADVFAIATHYEGFCMPVLEAMASGLPVVASRIGPIEEIVGDAGLLVENTPETFASALERLARSPELRRQLGARARARAITMDGRVMEEQERALYESLCRDAA